MGNFTSCFNSFNPTLQFATLLDIHGNLRRIKTPITAAEIMLLEQPGFLISPVGDDLRSSFRLSGLRAEEELSKGRFYLLIPIGRLNSFVTESELEILRSGCGKVGRKNGGGRRRRQAKVLPEEKSGGDGGGLGSLGEGFAGQRVCSSPVWKPVLEPIYE